MPSIFFISGASGSGKSTIVPDLVKLVGNNMEIWDFDSLGVPSDADAQWRQKTTESWLLKTLQAQRNVCLVGQTVLGEILSCPSLRNFENIGYCLLDVSDQKRIARMKERGPMGACNQHMLNWSSWLRVHYEIPTWETPVITTGAWVGLDLERWLSCTQWDPRIRRMTIDTTESYPFQVASKIADWMSDDESMLAYRGLSIQENAPGAFSQIDRALYAYNKECVPATQHPESIDISYTAMSPTGDFVGGIFLNAYTWHVAEIELLFVDRAQRGQGLAQRLLELTEKKAQHIGVKMIHGNTYDFQALEFYLKNGYKVFGTLDNCPEGHQRFYFSKELLH